MHGGLAQKPSTKASIWYGVQHATNAPRINEIVRKAFRARFSDFDFCRLPPSGNFLRPLRRLPIERIKSRLVVSFSLDALATTVVVDIIDVTLDRFVSTVVVTAIMEAALDVCDSTVSLGHALISTVGVGRSSIVVVVISSKLDFCVDIELTMAVTGRFGRSVTLTVVLNLLQGSLLPLLVGAEAAAVATAAIGVMAGGDIDA